MKDHFTQKDIASFFKNTKGPCEFSVLVFDNEGIRTSGCIFYYEFLSAFCAITRLLAQGKRVILTDKTGHDYLHNKEVLQGEGRVTYDEMLPYALQFDQWGNKTNNMK